MSTKQLFTAAEKKEAEKEESMSAIEVSPEQDFTATGDIRLRREYPLVPAAPGYIIVRDRTQAAAPAMLAVRDDLKHYIDEVRVCPYKEGRMLKRWHYNQWCELRSVDVLDENGETVKTIREGVDWRPFIGEPVKEMGAET